MEYVIIAIVLAAAAAYLGYAAYRKLSGKGGCCCGADKDGCGPARGCPFGKVGADEEQE